MNLHETLSRRVHGKQREALTSLRCWSDGNLLAHLEHALDAALAILPPGYDHESVGLQIYPAEITLILRAPVPYEWLIDHATLIYAKYNARPEARALTGSFDIKKAHINAPIKAHIIADTIIPLDDYKLLQELGFLHIHTEPSEPARKRLTLNCSIRRNY